MRIREVLQCAVLLAACAALPLKAQRLVVLPGSGGGDTVSAFLADPLSPAVTMRAAPGAFAAFAKPDGSILYIVTPASVVVLNASGAQAQTPLNVPQTATAAALSPDGQRLVVIAGDASAGSAYVYDTSNQTAALLGTIPIGANPLDAAFGQDSKTAYALSAGRLTLLDLTTVKAGASMSLSASVEGKAKPGVSVGPGGLVYVNASGAIRELDPTTLATRSTIAVKGFPGKPEFRPESSMALVVNQLGSAGGDAIAEIDITSKAVVYPLNGVSLSFDQAYVLGGWVYLHAPGNGALLTFELASPTSTWDRVRDNAGAYLPQYIKSIAPSTGAGEPKYLYLAYSNKVARLELATKTVTSEPLTTGGGAAFYLPLAQHGSAATAVQFNADQTVALGAWSLPLLVRITDARGAPVQGQAVKWTVPAGVTLRNAMTSSNAQGYVSAFATGSKKGKFTITAQLADTQVNLAPFTLTVVDPPQGGGDEPGGGVISGPAAAIEMVSGNGQISARGMPTMEPLVVRVTDAAGTPVAGAPVTFEPPATNGYLSPNRSDTGQMDCASTATGGLTCKTDDRGLASVFFVPSMTLDPWFDSVKMQVTASMVDQAGATHSTVFTALGIAEIRKWPAASSPSNAPTTFSGKAGDVIKGAIRVQVFSQEKLQPVAGAGLSLRTSTLYKFGEAQPAQCAGEGGVVLADAQGVAVCDLVLGDTPGTYQMWRVVGGLATAPLYTVTIAPGPPAPKTITITGGNNQSGAVNTKLPVQLAATVKDQAGNLMANQAVSWTVLPEGAATLQNASEKTDSQGRATATVLLGANVGTIQIRLKAGNASAIFSATAEAVIENLELTAVSGDGQSAPLNAAFANPLVVKAAISSAAQSGLAVSFSATNGSLSATSVTTDGSGQAQVYVTAGPNTGPVEVTASAGGKSVTFHLRAQLPWPELTPASFLNGASFTPGFAAGSVVTIKAAGLTSALNVPAGTCLTDDSGLGLPTEGGALPTTLAGIEVQFGSELAPIFAICRNEDGTEQINVQAPFGLAPGTVTVILRYKNAGREFPVEGVAVQSAAPGIFEYAVGNALAAVATKADGSVISPSNPAHPGDTIHVYTTGFGSVPGARTNVPATSGQAPAFSPTATLGGVGMGGVTAAYADIGLVVVTFQIPSGQALGDAVELIIGAKIDDKAPVNSQKSHIAIK